ncbi:MAG: hypothetical protein A2Y22_00980 [Clostridiales bacterium GWD2_32_59]|nr:MAG: hypothetical protein A2Y22_00980 [Clostridiales bacterium GWD2_32_59]
MKKINISKSTVFKLIAIIVVVLVLGFVVLTMILPQSQQVSQMGMSATTQMSTLNSAIQSNKSIGIMAENTDGMMQPVQDEEFNTERYTHNEENEFKSVKASPVSTFSVDVDTAAYSNIRRYINEGQLPPSDAVRLEEMINYFDYKYEDTQDEHPFSTHVEITKCPWNEKHELALVNLKAKKIENKEMPNNNLVLLVDTSGSMSDPNKLPLLKEALKMLVEGLTIKDKISIVTYAGSEKCLLEGVTADRKGTIFEALDNLESGGSTNGEGGIKLAYKIASENFIKEGNNRVILATDGDLNVGITDPNELNKFIKDYADKGVFITTAGFGGGNYNDTSMEEIANKSNGNYVYIDSEKEAKKVFIEAMTGTLVTVAKDVKIQVEFNPSKVKEYRLIGYENRILNTEDFNNDKKDAGEIGAGHTVTALYELITADSEESITKVDDLKYQQNNVIPSKDWFDLKLRYKKPNENESKLITYSVTDEMYKTELSNNLRFASSVVEWGLLLKDSKYKGNASVENIISKAQDSAGEDEYKKEFIELVKKYKDITSKDNKRE